MFSSRIGKLMFGGSTLFLILLFCIHLPFSTICLGTLHFSVKSRRETIPTAAVSMTNLSLPFFLPFLPFYVLPSLLPSPSCVCVWCMYVCMCVSGVCVCRCMHIPVCVVVRLGHQVSCTIILCLISLRQDLSLNLELDVLVRLVSRKP